MADSDNDVNLINSDNDDTKVKDRLKVFVEYFVEQFESKLLYLHMILKEEIKKPGKIANILARIGGQASGGILGYLLMGGAGAGAGAGLGGAVAESVGNSISSECYRKKVANLQDLIDSFFEDKPKFRRSLVEVGVDVFQSFEMQFMRLTTEEGYKRAMLLLAKDVTNRALNYYIDYKDACLTKGVILGESKTEFRAPNKIIRGFEIIYEYGSTKREKWSTASLFEKVGLVIDEEASSGGVRYYEKKDEGKSKDTIYGYRRLFNSEVRDELINHYKSSDPNKRKIKKSTEKGSTEKESTEKECTEFTGYQYILGTKEIHENVETILKKINLDDTDLIEERIKEQLQECKDDIDKIFRFLEDQKNLSEEDRKKLDAIEARLNSLVEEYLNDCKKYLEDAKQERQEIANKVEEGRNENRDTFRQIQEFLDNLNQVSI